MSVGSPGTNFSGILKNDYTMDFFPIFPSAGRKLDLGKISQMLQSLLRSYARQKSQSKLGSVCLSVLQNRKNDNNHRML